MKKTGILILILSASCQIFDKSENLLIGEFYNPKANIKVIVFEKQGNASLNNSIHASIHGYEELNDEDVGNIFVADKIEGIKNCNDSFLIIKWIDNEIVEISHPKNIRTFKNESQFENNVGKVKIEYKINE